MAESYSLSHTNITSNSSKPSITLTDKEEFFINFFQYREILSINIDGYEIKKDGKQEYTVYKINISTIDLNYYIEKRYKQFYYLYQNICNKYKKIEIVDFPSKKLFGNMSKNCLSERKVKLEDFLQQLQNQYKEFKLIDFLEFLHIYDNYNKEKINLNYISNLKASKQFASTKDDFNLLEFLIQLNIYPQNRLQIFQKINDFLFEQKPKLSTKIVEILIKGEKIINGLLQIISSCHSQNHLVCSIGLKLFCSLFDYEHNKAAEFFLSIYLKISLEEFRQMNLEEHICEKPSKNCKEYALKLMQYYLNANPEIERSFKFKEQEELMKEYTKYKNRKSLVCQKIERRYEGDYFKIRHSNLENTNFLLKNESLTEKSKLIFFHKNSSSN